MKNDRRSPVLSGALRRVSGAATFASIVAGTAFALPVAANAEPSAPEYQLEEVVVTARKRTENLQSIPESIIAVSAQELYEAHITKLDDLGGLASNLNITTRADNNPDVVLRGVGSFGVVQGVGFYVNDVQLFDGQTVRPDDLERVEILKGPQGTLYGGNNIGGAVKYITKLPTDTFEGQVAIEAGNYNSQTYSAFVSGPLSPGVLDGRASFYDSQSDGYIFDTILNRKVDGGSVRGGRATLLYKNEATTATLFLDADQNRSGAGANLYYRPDSPSSYTLNVTDGTLPAYSRDLYSVTFRLEHEVTANVLLTSISSYLHSSADSVNDTDKGPIPFLIGINHFRHEVGSQEFRLASSGAGPFKWLVGLFGQVNDFENVNTSRSFNGDPGDPTQYTDPAQFSDQVTDPVQRRREYALFGNGSLDLNKWTFEAGVRADYNDSSMTDPLYGLYSKQNGTQVVPKVSASYHFDKDVMAYATVSRGFEPGDFVEDFDQNSLPFIFQYKPETTWNYEAGVKTTLFDRVRLNAAVFYIKYSERLFQTNVIRGGQFVGVTDNIGSSHNYGGEFDLSARLTKDFFATASFGITKAIWDNIPWFDPDLNQATNLQGRTATNTPEYQGSVSIDWSHHLTDTLVVGARADALFVGRQFWDVTDHFEQTPYQLFNLGVRLEDRRWALSAHVSNLANRLYNTAYISAAELGAPFGAAGVGRPRLWTVAFAYRW